MSRGRFPARIRLVLYGPIPSCHGLDGAVNRWGVVTLGLASEGTRATPASAKLANHLDSQSDQTARRCCRQASTCQIRNTSNAGASTTSTTRRNSSEESGEMYSNSCSTR